MGKRELLLIVAFAIVGVVVYQVTAPPPAAGERSFSPGQIFENIRRGVRGNRAVVELVNKSTHPVAAGVTELRVTAPNGAASELTIVGEDRGDISAEIKVRSAAFDDAEAERTAKATVLNADAAGNRMTAFINFPKEGRQTASLTLRVPARLAMHVESGRSGMRVSNVASLEVANGRSESELRQIRGPVTGSYRGGELRLVDVDSVKFTTTGTDVRIERVARDTTLNMRGGELKAAELGGAITVETTGVDVEIEKLEKTSGPIRITATAGSVSITGLRTEARIDARNAEVEATIDRAAPIGIFSEGGSAVEITPPAGGYQLDAVAADGHIELPEGLLQVTNSGTEYRATGPVKGGGPTITIRTQHASITVRER
jgi:hypothetical protein